MADQIAPLERQLLRRFVFQEILPNGVLDFDLMVLLKRRLASHNAKQRKVKPPKIKAPKAVIVPKKVVKQKTVSQTNQVKVPTEDRGLSCPTSSPGQPCDDGYINLQDFLKNKTP